VPVYDRDALLAGERIAGPAVIEERSSTLVVGPDSSAEVAASGNIIVTLG
jgi:N-methylhydantoinase A